MGMIYIEVSKGTIISYGIYPGRIMVGNEDLVEMMAELEDLRAAVANLPIDVEELRDANGFDDGFDDDKPYTKLSCTDCRYEVLMLTDQPCLRCDDKSEYDDGVDRCKFCSIDLDFEDHLIGCPNGGDDVC